MKNNIEATCYYIIKLNITDDGFGEEESNKIFEAMISDEKTDWDVDWIGDLILVKEIRRYR